MFIDPKCNTHVLFAAHCAVFILHASLVKLHHSSFLCMQSAHTVHIYIFHTAEE